MIDTRSDLKREFFRRITILSWLFGVGFSLLIICGAFVAYAVIQFKSFIILVGYTIYAIAIVISIMAVSAWTISLNMNFWFEIEAAYYLVNSVELLIVSMIIWFSIGPIINDDVFSERMSTAPYFLDLIILIFIFIIFHLMVMNKRKKLAGTKVKLFRARTHEEVEKAVIRALDILHFAYIREPDRPWWKTSKTVFRIDSSIQIEISFFYSAIALYISPKNIDTEPRLMQIENAFNQTIDMKSDRPEG